MTRQGKAAIAKGTFLIRDAGFEELDDIAELMLRAYEEYVPSPLPEALAEAWHAYWRDVGDVRGRLDDTELIVAECGGRIDGAVTFYPDGSRSQQNRWPAGWAAIPLLAVLPEARGQGIGRALTEECLSRARRYGAMAIGLHTSNWMRIAKGMYERIGFQRVPEFDFRPVPEEIALAYKLDLPSEAAPEPVRPGRPPPMAAEVSPGRCWWPRSG